MTKPAAITAKLVDVRNIAAHKCVRLEIHVPAEQAGAVLQAFGWPTMVDPIDVAVARLDVSKFETKPEKERRKFDELPLAQQAALRCAEKRFHIFLTRKFQFTKPLETDDDAAGIVRWYLDVGSRSEIEPNTRAGDEWQKLDAEYVNWHRGYEALPA